MVEQHIDSLSKGGMTPVSILECCISKHCQYNIYIVSNHESEDDEQNLLFKTVS